MQGFELPNTHGAPLRGDVFEPETGLGPFPVVVVCHGFKGFKNWGFFPELGRRLAAAGFVAVTFNFSGSGIGADLENFTELDRFASDTLSKQIADLGNILDALTARRIGSERGDLHRLAVLGHSRGGAVAIVRAREDARVRAVVTWAGVSSVWRYTQRELAEWRRRGSLDFLNTRTQQLMRIDSTLLDDLEANRDRFDIPHAVAALDVPLLVIHGEQDVSVPVREAETLAAAAPGRCTLRIIPATGHTFDAVHPWAGSAPGLDAAIAATIEWLQGHLARNGNAQSPLRQAEKR